MSGDVVIRAEGLGKKYLVSQRAERTPYVSLRDVAAQAVTGIVRKTAGLMTGRQRAAANAEEFWALRDVNFEVRRGEVLGVIGRNGAGKSTLLKILSRITEPSEGRVTINGRIASLLEVGTGFHPELTGRENVFLNGAILGMTRSEIRRKFDEIVAFAEVEQFLDMPVKRYSSGMYVRLAFAVAAHLEPDILIVDEVLAVGDTEFQKKCMGKMDDVAHAGRTVLFVSHSLRAVASLCRHGLLLSKGRVVADAGMQEVISAYALQSRGYENLADNILLDRPVKTDLAASGLAGMVTRVEMLTPRGLGISTLHSDAGVVFRIWYRLAMPVPRGTLVFMIKNPGGFTLAKFETNPEFFALPSAAGDYHADCHIDQLPLLAGHYLVGAGLGVQGVKMIDWSMGERVLTVRQTDEPALEMNGAPDGVLALRHRWEVLQGATAPLHNQAS